MKSWGNFLYSVNGKGVSGSIQTGDKTPKGRIYTKHGAEQANERGFTSQKVDEIIDNNFKKRVKEINPDGKVQWRYQDKRGNTVITNEFGDKIVTTYSHPKSINDGNYISKQVQRLQMIISILSEVCIRQCKFYSALCNNGRF